MKGDTGSGITPVEQPRDEDAFPAKKVQETAERKGKRIGLDHPFSIESILNGTTTRKRRVNLSEVEECESAEENDPLPLNALEKFASKTFSSMKTSRTPAREKGNYLLCISAQFFCIRHVFNLTKTHTISTERELRENGRWIHMVYIVWQSELMRFDFVWEVLVLLLSMRWRIWWWEEIGVWIIALGLSALCTWETKQFVCSL